MRHNEFENKIMQNIKAETNAIEYPALSLRATEVMKQNDDRPKLFTDAGSPYPTPIGKQKRTEFVLHCPSIGIDWRIECKSRQSLALIGEITTELNNVTEIPEKLYCLVLNQVLNVPYILNKIQQEIDLRQLNDRVWYGTAQQFETKLKQQMK